MILVSIPTAVSDTEIDAALQTAIQLMEDLSPKNYTKEIAILKELQGRGYEDK